eukprot:1800431-Pleurochrysis_carterae.AAC.16
MWRQIGERQKDPKLMRKRAATVAAKAAAPLTSARELAKEEVAKAKREWQAELLEKERMLVRKKLADAVQLPNLSKPFTSR